MSAYSPTAVTPLIFGGQLACGLPGDELTGQVDMPLFGTGIMSFTFTIPIAVSGLQIALCLWSQGNPTAPVSISLLNTSGTQVGSASIPASAVSSVQPTWSSFVTMSLTGTLPSGLYTTKITSPSSTSSSFYFAYMNLYGSTSWWDVTSTSSYNPPAGSSYGGNNGSPSIWLKDGSGNDVAVLPFGLSQTPSTTTTFVAQSSYSINCLMPWQSDIEFVLPEGSAGYTLTDLTTGTVLGTAPASQYHDSHGIFGVLAYQMPSTVQITQGHTYQISLQDFESTFGVLLRGATVNPTEASPTGEPTYWYGQIGLGDYSQYRILDYPSTQSGTGQNGHGGIGGTDWIAARIESPTSDTITTVRLKMQSPIPSGTPITISLLASNENVGPSVFANPAGSPLASATITAGTDTSGWLIGSVSFPVTANVPVWIAWSAPASAVSAYSAQRCVSPFRNLALASQNGGSSWAFFGQGPTDLAFAAICSSGQVLGSPFDTDIILSTDTTSSFVAAPFILSQGGMLSSVFAWVGGNGIVKVAIYPDSGSGPSMGTPLATGSFDTFFTYFYSGTYIPLTAPLQITPNTKYWSVFSGNNTITAASYWTRPVDPSIPSGYETLVTTDGGTSWAQASTEVASAIFMVGVQPTGAATSPPPPPPTVTPSTLTLTAQVTS